MSLLLFVYGGKAGRGQALAEEAIAARQVADSTALDLQAEVGQLQDELQEAVQELRAREALLQQAQAKVVAQEEELSDCYVRVEDQEATIQSLRDLLASAGVPYFSCHSPI